MVIRCDCAYLYANDVDVLCSLVELLKSTFAVTALSQVRHHSKWYLLIAPLTHIELTVRSTSRVFVGKCGTNDERVCDRLPFA